MSKNDFSILIQSHMDDLALHIQENILVDSVYILISAHHNPEGGTDVIVNSTQTDIQLRLKLLKMAQYILQHEEPKIIEVKEGANRKS